MVAISQLASRISRATDFVTLATAVCDESGASFDVQRCAVVLHGDDRRPVVMVDNALGRVRFPSNYGVVVADLGTTGEATTCGDEHRYLLPILTPTGLVGSIQLGRAAPFPPALQRDLATMATHVSVRFAQLGITAVSPLATRPALTPHQRDVARLAARGDTNARIAAQLAVSQNTVKMHLKEAFARLDVANRTELANVFAKRVPAVDVPLGVTRLSTVTVTRLR